MDSNNSETYSIHSLSAPLSIKSETKNKFDALMKAAQHDKSRHKRKIKKTHNTQDDLESTTASSENLVEKNTEATEDLVTVVTEGDGEYILKKFLNQTVDGNNPKITPRINKSFKAPVPKPRNIRKKVQENKEVYEQNNDGSSSSNNLTYNVKEVGDMIIHESPFRPKILIKTESSTFLEKGETETLSDRDDSTANNTEKLSPQNKDRMEQSESIELVEINKANGKNATKDDETIIEMEEETKLDKSRYNYEKIIELVIHKTDRLQMNSFVVHPVVKIHIVDAATGKYFPKSDKNRSVVFFYENSNCDYISPVMTSAFNLQEKRTLFPAWEESVLFNEDFQYLTDESHRLIFFFEILDFVPFSIIQQSSSRTDCAKGWHNIAFAFLKVTRSSDGTLLNVGSKIRLQLYHSYQGIKGPHICKPWNWWRKKKLTKYPSTLYITIKKLTFPKRAVEVLRSRTPMQGERGSRRTLSVDPKNEHNQQDGNFSIKSENLNDNVKAVTWSRNPDEPCKIPNKSMGKFFTYADGCFVMKFSNNGKYLACGMRNDDIFCIIIYSVVTFKQICKLSCHQGLIYDVKWSRDDSLVLSASADNTVSIVDFEKSSLLQILPHPSFVYSCDISNDSKIIATGCYDGILRIWNSEAQDNQFHLFQELNGHKGYITSVVFSKRFNIFSSDSRGIIIEWTRDRTLNDWKLGRELFLLDLKDTIINQLVLFSKEKKILVHSRDSVLRVVDVRSGCVLQWLHGAINKRIQTFCSVSSCGTYVFSGSENGFVHMWNCKNGSEVAVYTPFSSNSRRSVAVHCVEFHPCDNIIAVSHYGENLPILLYCYEKHIEEPLTDLKLKEDSSIENQNNVSTLKNIVYRNISGLKKNENRCSFKDVLRKMDEIVPARMN